MSNPNFDPNNVNLSTVDQTSLICYLQLGQNEYNGSLGARVSALFVILIVSSAATFFPVMSSRTKRFKVPLYIYLFARYFGAGVIIATAFIHLMDPAYQEIGPQSCVGMTGGWAVYSWPPAIILASVMVIFLMDFGAERYVEIRYGISSAHPDVQGSITDCPHTHEGQSSAKDEDEDLAIREESGNKQATNVILDDSDIESMKVDRSFRQQIAAFLILEFGVIFHSVIIGLNLGTAGREFTTLYPVLVFHQSFEGLGIGARLSAIPFPKRYQWLPWALCAGYGLTTPIAIAIGLGLKTTYNGNSFTADVVSGVFDSMSAGILIYTGLVELLARDFLFNPERTSSHRQLTFMIVCTLVGAGVMALLGKWA